MPEGQRYQPTDGSASRLASADVGTERASASAGRRIVLTVDGVTHEIDDRGDTLLDVLRHELGITSAKDGCSPQGQCGCCTVLVDGQPRVACVTPARRVNGRTVTTLDGLDPDRRTAWGDAFCASGGSQCGFCTPGIIVRLDALDAKAADDDFRPDKAAVDQALLAHLCRCTGWQTVHEAWDRFGRAEVQPIDPASRDLVAASRRAEIEGGTAQRIHPDVALGRGGFAADTAPAGSLIAMPDDNGEWVVASTAAAARAGRVQGRRTTIEPSWPIAVPQPAGQPWVATLRTTWVEPAYLETDAAWCEPGGEPSSPLANGGAFGGKVDSGVGSVARRLADEHGQPVLALASREHTVKAGPKRPPVAGGIRADGTGVLRVVATPGVIDAITKVAPGLEVQPVMVHGPTTSSSIRAAGWAEALILMAGATGEIGEITSPSGARASARISADGIHVSVRCGDPLDEVILRSYCIGAAHMAWSWLTSEALAVDDDGAIHDLTIRSFGVLRAVDTPPIHVEIEPDDGEPVNGSDAVFAAVAAAGWIASGCKQDWPVGTIEP